MALERRAYTVPLPQFIVASHGAAKTHAATSRRVAVVCSEAFGVSRGGAATGADLGGSSKYSNENFEGRSGEGFHVNSS